MSEEDEVVRRARAVPPVTPLQVRKRPAKALAKAGAVVAALAKADAVVAAPASAAAEAGAAATAKSAKRLRTEGRGSGSGPGRSQNTWRDFLAAKLADPSFEPGVPQKQRFKAAAEAWAAQPQATAGGYGCSRCRHQPSGCLSCPLKKK